ncbi:MAG: glycoside hydrolase family 16 protein [Candidatus Izemoplasmatales bacterium]
MIKKILVFSCLSIVLATVIGCDLSTTQATTEPTTVPPTTGTTGTALIDTIPDECSAIPVTGGWIPVWCDEFEEETPTTIVDPSKWTYHTGGGGFGNQELQYYKNADPDNIAIVDGALVITALKETYGTNSYTSTKLWTQATASWKYGKIEMRAKLPEGRGTWPAFWMMPKISKYGNWPDSGEIDIMEHVGYDMNTVLGTLHTERFNGTNGRGGNTDSLITAGTVSSIDVANTYHTYGVVWNEDGIEWYFDGYRFGGVEADDKWRSGYNYDTSVDWPFDQQFYLILNLAIGGTWGGAQGVDDTIFPATFTIDYVRIYQQDYVTGDTMNPSPIDNPVVLWQEGRQAFIRWVASVDDLRVKTYNVYINGALTKKVAVNAVLLTTLKLDSVNVSRSLPKTMRATLRIPTN